MTFIAFLPTLPLSVHHSSSQLSHPRRRPRVRIVPRLSISASPGNPPRDDNVPRDDNAFRGIDSTKDSKKREDVPKVEVTRAFADLGEPDIKVDPVKSVPAALVDASGALQLDDGSLAPSVVMPRRFVRRRDKGKFDVQELWRQLKEGFDTGVGAAVLLIALFMVWYWANTVFNVYNKQVLKVFPYPLTCTTVQFAVAGALMGALWLFRLKRPPRVNRFLVRYTFPLAVLHAAGFLLTNMSLGKVSVAFTHTVKSTEPFFSVALTPSILGDVPTWGILGSLIPIVAGVALASANEVSFNWIGLLSALGSNLAMQSRNVLSKKLMNGNDSTRVTTVEEDKTLESLDNVNLFSTMSIFALFLLIPICFMWEGIPFLTAAVSTSVTGIAKGKLYMWLIVAGMCRCLDVLSSYIILQRVSPVTHSVGNCVKRAVVIVVSIFFFQTKMNALNIAGTLLALTGVLLYSLVVSACKQNSLGPDSPFCKPIYETEVELTEGGGI